MSSNISDRALLIFARSPLYHDVKTRLSPLLDLQQRHDLHVALLQDSIEKALATDLPVYLYLTAPNPLPFSCDLPIEIQTGDDLGARMLQAFTVQLSRHSKVAIIGTDSPTFNLREISDAMSALDENDVVLGPCDDGGYYLIAMKESLQEPFKEIPWGSANVLDATLNALKNYKVHLLKPYFDVDRPEDLVRLKREAETGSMPFLSHTRLWLRTWQTTQQAEP